MLNNSQHPKKLRIILEHNSQVENLDVDSFRTLKEIKLIAMKMFYPMNFSPRVVYSNKDITQDENLKLEQIFKNKNSIHIKLLRPLSLSLANVSKSADQQFKTIKNPPRMSSSDLFSPSHLAKDKENLNDYNKFDQCCLNHGQISNFCFSCKEFSCFSCRNKHITHQTVHTNIEDVEESIKIYSIQLQTTISKNLTRIKNYQKHFDQKDLIDTMSRTEILHRRLEEFEKLYDKNLKLREDVEKLDFDKFKMTSANLNREIDKIVKSLTYNLINKQKKISSDEAKAYFESVFEKQLKVDELNNLLKKCTKYFEFDKKIDELFNCIEADVQNLLKCVNTNDNYKENYSSQRTNGKLKNFNKINLKTKQIEEFERNIFPSKVRVFPNIENKTPRNRMSNEVSLQSSPLIRQNMLTLSSKKMSNKLKSKDLSANFETVRFPTNRNKPFIGKGNNYN